MPAHCHELIAKTAKEMAHEIYNTLMENNAWYAAWKKQYPAESPTGLEKKFVARTWPRLIDTARATLAKLLEGPLDEELKHRAYEALQLDASLIRGRGRVGQNSKIIGSH